MNKILLGSAVAVLLLAGCGDEKKTTTETVTKVETQAVEAIKKDVAKVTEATKDAAQTVSKETVAVVETANKAVENVTNATETKVSETAYKIEEVKETTKEIAVNVIDETKQAASNLTEDVKTIVNKTVEEKTAAVEAVATEAVAEVQALDGELLYKSCASCHGLKGEKEALGKSQVIAGWNKEKTIQALNGYKDGTYGGVMKNIMKGQVATKTDLEIDALASFISNL